MVKLHQRIRPRKNGILRGELQPARHGRAPLRSAHPRALPKGIDLPRLCARSAEKECCADLSAHAGQPRAQPGGCARSQRTRRTDRGAQDGDCQIKGALQRAEELSDDVAAAIERAL